jgi:multidrug efflux pump subunit AcrB
MTFQRKAIFYFLMVCIIVGGVLAFDSISKLEDPEITVMQSQIITVYPGATAHEVEMQVTNVIEEELSSLENVETIKSKSSANISLISVMLELTVPQKEIEQRWDFLRRRIKEVQPKLPAGAQEPLVVDDFGDVYGMFYAMTGDGYSYKEMHKMAQYIKREMLAVEGVSKVEIFGSQPPVVDVIIPVSRAGEMDVFPFQLLTALNGQNSTVYPGTFEIGDNLLNVSVNNKIEDVSDIENVMVQGIGGEPFKLSDIATVEEGYNEPLRHTMFLNNKKAIAISLSMESGENIIKVGERVDNRLKELKKNIPAGYEFEKVFFQPDKVDDAIDGFMINLVASVAIVILVLMLTMGLRSGFIIGTGLALTILATFPLLLASGGTLQRISLGAFIVAMGMLVDNAIVVIDGILVDLKRGIKHKKAMVNSAKRTAWPLLGATVIAVSAFLPVYLSDDAAGTYARDLFVVLCISLLVSWILAITQVPLFADKLLKKKEKKKKENDELYNSWAYRKFRNVLAFLLHYKTATLIVSAILLALAAFNFQNIKKTFFPDFNYNQVYIEYKLPEGTSPERVNADLKKITEDFLKYEEVKMVVSSHGMTPTRYCLVRAMGEMSDSYGELIVNFDDYDTMVRMKPELTRYLHENYPDAYTRIRKYNLSIKATHTVEVEFTGPDPAVLRDLSEQAQAVFRKNPYADPYTISDDWEPLGQALVAKYNQASARRAGPTRSDVSNAILAATDGLPVGEYFEGETRIGINLKMRKADGSKVQKLEEIPVWSTIPNVSALNENNIQKLMYGGKSLDELKNEIVSPVPLNAVTDGVDLNWQERIVRRVNGQRAIQAQCDPIEGYSPALVRKTSLEEISNIEMPDGYEMRWVGEQELQGDALRNIFRYLPISIMLIILTLILLFNDFRKPVIVLMCIPMAFIGIVPGMILAGQPFTFMAIIGSFGLMGMIVKNAIVLLDELEKRIAEGAERYHAIIDATISRTRPVLMASFTTILGMIPLFGDPMYESMATAIISGLLIGTLITLLFVPILYAAFFGVKRVKSTNE